VIAAVLDGRGGSSATSAVRGLLAGACVESAIVREGRFGAIAYCPGPLVEYSERGGARIAVMGGGPGLIGRFRDDTILHDPCCLFALTDDPCLLLARGPFGGRPLYFAVRRHGEVVLACTRLAPLVASLGEAPSLDTDGLAALLWERVPSTGSATPYREISRVQSCETLRFDRGRVQRDMRVPSRPQALDGSPRELGTELARSTRVAVERACSGFKHVAVLTGGGLDSAGLLSMVAARQQTTVGFSCDAFAIDYGEPNTDPPHLRALEAFLDLTAHRVRPAEAAPLLPKMFVVDAAPYEWPMGSVEVLMFRRAREAGAEAVLSGVGGDSLFDGDLQSFAETARRGHVGRAILDAALLRPSWPSSPLDRIWSYVLRPLMVQAVSSRPSMLARRVRRVRRTDRWAWAGPQLQRRILDGLARPPEPKREWYSRLASSPIFTTMSDARGQLETATGTPEVDPYLDSDLVRFVASIPPAAMFHGHRIRGLYRSAMKGSLPESLRMRSDKATFEPATRELYRGAKSSAGFAKLARMEALGDLGLVEPRAFQLALARWENGPHGAAPWDSLWGTIGVEAFVQAFGARGDVNRSPSPSVTVTP
jgi:asparagine synthase (glutamine-hydrolysing)